MIVFRNNVFNTVFTLLAHTGLWEEEKRPPSDLTCAWTEKQVNKIQQHHM